MSPSQAASINNGFDSTFHTKQWANDQSGQMGAKYAPYSGSESIPVSQFTGSGQNSQFNGSPVSASYVASNSPYQQYPVPIPQQQDHQQQDHQQQGPPQQHFQQQGPPQQNFQQQGFEKQTYSKYHQNKQYKQPAVNGPSFNQPTPQPQQGPQSYQAPFNNKYPTPDSPKQYGPPNYLNSGQQFHSHSATPSPFYTQSKGYKQGYNNHGPSSSYQSQGSPNQRQWNGSPTAAIPFNPSPQQQIPEQQNSGINHREFRRSQSQQSQRSESRVGSQQPQPDEGRVGTQQLSEMNNRGLYAPKSLDTPQTAYTKGPPESTEVSEASSVASTPYGSPTSRDNISEWDGQPVIPKEDSERTDEEKQFNWDFKKIFKPAGEKHETVALAQPLANRFDMTPVPLIDKKSTVTISRYARRENLKEYTRSVRTTPQWPYLQEDPTFQESQAGEDSVPIRDLDAFMKVKHGDAHAPIATRKVSAAISRTSKRKPSQSEQDDVDEQLQAEFSTVQTKRQKVDNQASASGDSMPVFLDSGAENKTSPLAEAPEEDIWAPQVGESADPTEALLASLGVSGAPKPVEPGPPVMIPIEDLQQSDYTTQQPSYPPQQAPSHNGQQAPYNTHQTPYNQQPQFNTQQPSYSVPQPPYNQQPPFHAQQPTYTQPLPFNAHQPSFHPQQPPYNQQPSFSPHPPQFNAQQPHFSSQQNSFNAQQPHFNAQQPFNHQRHPFNPNMANQPFRQDTGFANARPPFSGPQVVNQPVPPPPPPPPMEEEPMFDPWPEQNVEATPPPTDETDNDKENGKKGGKENGSPESPLSPTSLEILGKANKEPAKPRKIVRIISGKKGKDSSRVSEGGAVKLKRAAPVVDAAYR